MRFLRDALQHHFTKMDTGAVSTRYPVQQGHQELVFPVAGDKVFVEGLSSDISYSVKVYAHNGIGWGPASPASKPLKLADHQPPAPGAPVLERISADSVRVFCRLSPKCNHADVLFRDVDTGVELSVDAQSGNKLREPDEGVPPPRGDCYKGIVVRLVARHGVRGLLPTK